MPANLPDTRTAQRLLDIISQFEQTLRVGRQSSNAATGELESRLANLQFENQRLRSTRQQAAQRLTTLLTNLQAQLDTDSSTSESISGTLSSLKQEHAV